MKKCLDWLKISDRWKHLICGMLIGLGAIGWYCAAYVGLGVASALEYKDKAWGGKWDWFDWLMTIVGVMFGYTLKYLALLIIL